MRNLPIKRQGIYFLANGFPQCVAFNSGQDAGRIRVDREPYPPVDRAVGRQDGQRVRQRGGIRLRYGEALRRRLDIPT